MAWSAFWPINPAAPAATGFDPAAIAAIQARLHQAPGEEARQEAAAAPTGPAPSRWTLRTVRATIARLRSYSLSGVWRFLRRIGWRLRRAGVRQYSPDPDYATKLARLREVLQEATRDPQQVVVLFLDEMSYRRWPDPAPQWAPAAPAAPPQAARSAPNNQQWRIVGVLNAQSGQVNHLADYVVGRKQLRRFYQQIAAAYPQARRIYVVQDNWSIHRHPDVLAAVAELAQIELVWLPTYAPWLNPIEKLWRWLRQDLLKLHRQAEDWTGLRQAVQSFLEQFAQGSAQVLTYVGLSGAGDLAQALRHPT